MSTDGTTAPPPDADGSPRRRRARGSLSPEEILDAAQQIVERDGLRQLSMPVLADQLKSGVTSIYWYFRSKDALIDALTQRVMSDVHQQLPPVGDGPWHEELFRYFEAFHDLLQTLPAYREIVSYGAGFIGHSTLTGAARRRLDAGLALLASSGLTHEHSVELFTACLNYTRGFVALQQGVPAAPEDAASASQHEFLADLNRVDDERFRSGLRVLIAGVRAEVASLQPAPRAEPVGSGC